jgi:hypothetical protein
VANGNRPVSRESLWRAVEGRGEFSTQTFNVYFKALVKEKVLMEVRVAGRKRPLYMLSDDHPETDVLLLKAKVMMHTWDEQWSQFGVSLGRLEKEIRKQRRHGGLNSGRGRKLLELSFETASKQYFQLYFRILRQSMFDAGNIYFYIHLKYLSWITSAYLEGFVQPMHSLSPSAASQTIFKMWQLDKGWAVVPKTVATLLGKQDRFKWIPLNIVYDSKMPVETSSDQQMPNNNLERQQSSQNKASMKPK